MGIGAPQDRRVARALTAAGPGVAAAAAIPGS
jgi:hypothetical protein